MLPTTCILLICLLSSLSPLTKASSLNLTLPHQHPNPEAVAQEVQRRVNASLSRRQMLSLELKEQQQCLIGNPIDDCWRCDSNWARNRQKLADCGIGFGQDAMGGKGGQIYIVTDSSDRDPANPVPGTLRHAVIQTEPLWIIFSADMTIKLKCELIVNSFKTIDGRGFNVHVTGGGCITLQYVSNIIIHNIRVHHCKPAGNTNVASSPTHVGWRGKSDGDGISLFGARKIWIDHCSLSYCADGLVDAIMGSTGITISNSYFAHHDEVMLLGHDDKYLPDSGMQVTIAFNHFGEALVQRMPRCRRGYIHVVNNDFTQWEMYAIGGSANPTINSQGNRYTAPQDQNAKEVTKRVDTNEGDWSDWNWRTDGDIMVNGAFFVPSGAGMSTQYARASSTEPKSVALIDRLTNNAGVFGDPRSSSSVSHPGDDGSGTITDGTNTGSEGSSGGDGDYFGMIFGNGAPPSSSSSSNTIFLSLLIIFILYVTINHGGALLSLPLLLTLL
ncbi:PREDICTED: probable pectate lyase 5 [Prunus mume]|uniref:Pectate lyase n=1 Tax=Prunus mume TaxID=102107 RepID=A0ABM0P1Z2_PRUMU|nr:PREDICTED: probable pectate lyase 5 [Prunus mume]